MTAILNVLGVAIVLLSMFLVINTVNVLLNQHIKQIGIMKAIGGRLDQLVVMYIVLIMSFGVLALLVAAPLSAMAAYAVCGMLSGFINIHLSGFRMVQSAFTLQAITALGVPLAAGLVPVLGATRITVRESDQQLWHQQRKENFTKGTLGRISGVLCQAGFSSADDLAA